ncbi:MAG: hypothetical protein AB1349_06490 [Elusimicrobiota bacterium]
MKTKYLSCVVSVLLALAAVILYQEGLSGFEPFLFYEFIGLIVFGALLIVLATYSIIDIKTGFQCALSSKFSPTEEQLETAKQLFVRFANASMAMGCISAIIGMRIMLTRAEDIAKIPHLMAISLCSLFWGFFFSEVVFTTLKNNVEKRIGKPSTDDKGRIMIGMLFTFVIISCFFMIMFELTAGFYTARVHREGPTDEYIIKIP